MADSSLLGCAERSSRCPDTVLDDRLTFTPTGTPKQWEMQGTGTRSAPIDRYRWHLQRALGIRDSDRE